MGNTSVANQPSAYPSSTSSVSHSANATSNEDLLKMIQQLQNKIDALSTSSETPTKKPFIRNQTHRYCWSHGACGHDGKHCRNRKEGHQENATFDNRMGGSTQYCKNVQNDKNQNWRCGSGNNISSLHNNHKIINNLHSHETSNLPYLPHKLNNIIAKGDSGASQHYFRLQDSTALNNVQQDPHGPTVLLPNNDSITASHTAHLPFSTHLSPHATKTSLFTDLQNNLISIGQLCDDGCTVTFTKDQMIVTKNSTEILCGTRSKSGAGLYNVSFLKIQTSTHHFTNHITWHSIFSYLF